MSLYHQILEYRPNAVWREDFDTRDDGDGQFISFWNEETLGPKPAIEDLPDGTAKLQEEILDNEALTLTEAEAELVARLEELAVIVEKLAKGEAVPPGQARVIIEQKFRDRASRRPDARGRNPNG